MTRDDIIRMAREAAVINCDCCLPFWPEEDQVNWEIFFERFANLVAAAEREECAKVLDEMAAADKLSNYYQVAALRIRERGAP